MTVDFRSPGVSSWRSSTRLVDRIPYLRLVEPGEGPPETGLEPERQGESSRDSGGPKNVLIVEDEPIIRELIEDILDLEGYRPVGVSTGSQGIVLFREKRHDLVVTDLVMPGIKGCEVARAIKAFSPDTPVIIVTGWDTEPYRTDIAEAGVDHVLRKPFDMRSIIGIANRLTGDPGAYGENSA